MLSASSKSVAARQCLLATAVFCPDGLMQRWHTATAAPSRPNWGAQGAAAIAAGDLDAAKRSFGAAVRAEVKNPLYRFQLAVVLEGLGEFAAAAEQLTIALRLDPKSIDAAR